MFTRKGAQISFMSLLINTKLKFPQLYSSLEYKMLLVAVFMQGSYRSWKTWKVMEFDNLDSRPGKSWNFGPGPGKSWNFMLANLYAAELPTVLDCMTCTREKH